MTDSIEGKIGHNGRPETPTDSDQDAANDTLRRFLISFVASLLVAREKDTSDPYNAGVLDALSDLGWFVFGIDDHFDEKAVETYAGRIDGIAEKIASPEELHAWITEALSTHDFTAISDYAMAELSKAVEADPDGGS